MKTLCLGFILFFSLSVYAQTPIFRHYTIDEGLPSNEVYKVIQDQKGYMWFATDQGVSRFNGYEFDNFTIEEGLPEATILDLYEDKKGRIWFVSLSLKLSYYQDDKIIQVEYSESAKVFFEMKSYPIYIKSSFKVDHQENICISLIGHGRLKMSYCNGTIQNIQTSKKGSIVVSYENGDACVSTSVSDTNKYLNLDIKLVRNDSVYILSTDSFLHHKDYSTPCLFSENMGENNIIVSLTKYLIVINDLDLKTRISNEYIIWLSKDEYNGVWIGFFKGGIKYFSSGDVLEKSDKHYLKDRSVSSIQKDTEGGLWFSTLDDGVYYQPYSSVSAYFNTEGESFNINDLEKGENSDVWFIANGAYIGKIHEGKIKYIKLPNYKKDQISKLLFDLKLNKLWVGTHFHLFSIINEKELNEIALYIKQGVKGMSCTYDLVNSSSGYILYGGSSCFLRIDKRSDEVVYSSVSESFVRMHVFLYEDMEGAIWIGCNKGLYRYLDNEYVYFGEKSKLLKNRVLNIRAFKNDEWLVMGTKEKGLLFFDKDRAVIQISTKDGLTSNFVSSIFVDGNIVWVGTNKGLNKIIIKDIVHNGFDITNYTTGQGLTSNNINDVLVIDSIVYVATSNGLNLFNKKHLPLKSRSTKIVFTKISISGTDTTLLDHYKLRHYQNSIGISYVGLKYRSNGQVTYKYMMEGVDKGWSITQNTEVRYSLLHPGSYKFKVIAMNEKGVWNKEPKVVSFSILPAYWQTLWFKILVISSFVIIVGMIAVIMYVMKLKEVEKRNKLEADKSKYRQLALTKQMNPHFIFNSLNSIQGYILVNNKKSANLYLAKFSELMRMVLINSQYNLIKIEEELNALRLYMELEQMRFDEKFEFFIDVNSDEILSFKIPPLIIQPFVENSIMHGIMNKTGKGNIVIKISKDEDAIVIVIKDDGVGRRKANEINRSNNLNHKSLGAKITLTRINVFNAMYDAGMGVVYNDLNDDFGNAKGTKVVIRLQSIY